MNRADRYAKAPMSMLRLVAMIALLSAVALACAAGNASAKHRAPAPLPASALSLPAAGTCMHGQTLKIAVHRHHGLSWKRLTVKVNGKVSVSLDRTAITSTVRLTHLPKGRLKMSVRLLATDGRSVTIARSYPECAARAALHVVFAGTGAGRVTATGLSCTSSCSHPYKKNTQLSLSAAPASGSSFAGWSGAGCSGTGACSLKMAAGETVTATFAKETPATATTTPTTTTPKSGTPTTTTPTTTTTATTPTPTPAGGPPAGGYTGSTSGGQNDGVSFYVSANSTQLQDVAVTYTANACTPTHASVSDLLLIPSISVNSDGSFSGSRQESTVVGNVPATATYTFSGQFQGLNAADNETATGTLSETVVFTNGSTYTCGTGTVPWTATYAASQGTQAPLPTPMAGSYTGTTSSYCDGCGYVEDGGVSFYVSPDSTELQDVAVEYTQLQCVPNTTTVTNGLIEVPSIPIQTDGSFSSTTSQTILVDNVPATATYTFSGHFHGLNSSGFTTVTGEMREDLTFNSGTAYSCTTNDIYWSGSRVAAQGQQSPLPTPMAGSYTGTTSSYCDGCGYVEDGGVSFYVSADSSEMQDVSVQYTQLQCDPNNTSVGNGMIEVPSIPIQGDGSFSSTTTEYGVVDNADATLTYTFNGHFHGLNSSGYTTVTGQMREDVTFTNGSSYSCTTGTVAWSGSRDSSQGVQSPLPTPLSTTYSGVTSSYCYGCGYVEDSSVAFNVASGGSALNTVSVPSVQMSCVPSASASEGIVIPSVAVAANGSFSASGSPSGTIEVGGMAIPATYGYSFAGFLHGPDASGNTRVSGTLEETVTYTYEDTPYSCDSNIVAWSAKS